MNTEGDSRAPDGHEDGLYDPPRRDDPARDAFIDLSDPTLTSFDIPAGTEEDGDEAYLPSLVNDVARYTGFLRVGKGGSATVRSCRDPHLGRIVAIKTLHPHLSGSAFNRSRFIQEARVMAQLEHPNVVPVHELGVDEDAASIYFTMKRVQGATLLQILQALRDEPGDYAEGFSPTRMLDVFIQVCQAVAFAHSKGVLHRDLKPDNILLGSFGEVLVVDWGLAKVHGEEDEGGGRVNLSGDEKGDVTLPGTVTGTPLNMSPEQAMGDVAAVDERSDVFSLGGLLYHILTLERPFNGKDVVEILHNVIHQDPAPPCRRAPGRGIARELDAICMKALAKQPKDRFQTLAEMIEELQRYRDGRPVACCPDSPIRRGWKWCRRHPVLSSTAAAGLAMLVLVLGATHLASYLNYRKLMDEGDVHREAGMRILREQEAAFRRLRELREENPLKLPPREELDQEKFLADKEDESADEFAMAELLYILATGEKVTARSRAALVAIFRHRIAYAQATDRPDRVGQLLRMPRRWLGDGFMRADQDDRTFFLDAERYVTGKGSLELDSTPPGAVVSLTTLTNVAGRLVARGEPRNLGPAPVGPLTLDKGRYSITLKTRNGRPEVVVPLWIEHAEEEQTTVILPDTVPEGMVYIPAGPFYAGGETARSHRRHQVDLDGFFIRETEVTFGEYREYWLATRSPGDLPRVRLTPDALRYRDVWDGDGEFIAGFTPDHPVVGITQASATRYCTWLGGRLGRVCRLPTSHEWEKAARGVDAREFPWGDGFDVTSALIAETPATHRPATPFALPGMHPTDRSPYGVLDLGGNVREWTSTPFGPERRGFFKVKGASAATPRRFLYSAYSSDTPVVPTDIGFRYVFEMDAGEGLGTGGSDAR